MIRKTVNTLIILLLVAPAVLSAGALERYQVPQTSTKPVTTNIDEQVYREFREKAATYSPDKRKKLQEYYRQKMKQAVRDRNFDAAEHYQKLLDILSSF